MIAAIYEGRRAEGIGIPRIAKALNADGLAPPASCEPLGAYRRPGAATLVVTPADSGRIWTPEGQGVVASR
jgi:hypothetical protein